MAVLNGQVSYSNISLSITEVFEYLQKFQERVGYELFKNEREIYSFGWNKKYDVKGEAALHVIHTNGFRMSLIHCSFDQPESVRVIFANTVFNTDDWHDLKNHIFACVQ